MNYKFAVIGLGNFGMTVARTLSLHEAEVLAVDIDENKIDDIRNDVAYAVTMDATDIRALKSQNVYELDAVVVAIGENFESLLLCTAHLIDMKIPRIITRASNPTQKMILEKMGIEEIISPEEDEGISMANRLLNPSFINFIPLPDGYEIVEVKTPKNIVDRTVGDLNLRKKYNVNLITVKRITEPTNDDKGESGYHVIGVPRPETSLQESDILYLMGKEKDIERLIEINK